MDIFEKMELDIRELDEIEKRYDQTDKKKLNLFRTLIIFGSLCISLILIFLMGEIFIHFFARPELSYDFNMTALMTIVALGQIFLSLVSKKTLYAIEKSYRHGYSPKNELQMNLNRGMNKAVSILQIISLLILSLTYFILIYYFVFKQYGIISDSVLISFLLLLVTCAYVVYTYQILVANKKILAHSEIQELSSSLSINIKVLKEYIYPLQNWTEDIRKYLNPAEPTLKKEKDETDPKGDKLDSGHYMIHVSVLQMKEDIEKIDLFIENPFADRKINEELNKFRKEYNIAFEKGTELLLEEYDGLIKLFLELEEMIYTKKYNLFKKISESDERITKLKIEYYKDESF